MIESGERHGEGVEIGAVAKALKVDPMEQFTECCPQERMDRPAAVMQLLLHRDVEEGKIV
jgi:hypothetical protein